MQAAVLRWVNLIASISIFTFPFLDTDCVGTDAAAFIDSPDFIHVVRMADAVPDYDERTVLLYPCEVPDWFPHRAPFLQASTLIMPCLRILQDAKSVAEVDWTQVDRLLVIESSWQTGPSVAGMQVF